MHTHDIAPSYWRMFEVRARQQFLQATFRIKLRTRGSVLGWIWVLSNPYHLILLNYFVFGNLTSQTDFSFFMYVASGYLPWHFFSQSVVMTTNHFLRFRGVVQSHPEDGLRLLTSELLANFIFFLICFLPLFHHWSILNAAALLLALANLFLITACLCFLAAATQCFLRDTQFLIPLLLNVMLFLSPILYKEGALPIALKWAALINPIYSTIEIFQRLAAGELTTAAPLWQSCAITASAFLIAYFVWKKVRNPLVLHV